VVTDGQTASSAEMFAALMHDSGVARIVGQNTAGDGCGSMTDTPPVELPHSHLRVRVPNCVRLRVDGSNEVAGIKPDLPIVPIEGEPDRARAYRLLESVAADLRSRNMKP
jgi:C-terminal processing protease CtpA/Prc